VALYLGNKQGNTATIKEHIKREFKKNMLESDPTKVEKMRKSAVMGLSNFYMYEAQRIAQQNKEEEDKPE